MSALPDGTYYLENDSVGGCLAFLDNRSPPAQVSPCDLNFQQQWQIQASSNTTYTVKNVAYNTYISPDQSSSALVQSSTLYSWYMIISPLNFIQVATNSTATLGWYDHNFNTNGSTVILSACCNTNGNYWLYSNVQNLDTTSSSTGSTHSSGQTWLVIGGIFIGVSVVLLVSLVFIVRRRKQQVLRPVGE
ncbi:hypothetical protein L210DRAFT_954462 [Boletus edulis BED1]|uniref:Ricin B lectin domain-containing protein n=1 Tax=Boletus edulis BED1 TaxID=1328754 RepID=A0AAD4BQU7_BOLED|nr:hypothetical protein L210DRAFT_954462 [Boletus edulis BED1]